MEIVQYICEFFFCNFWHYLGLVFILLIICGRSIIKISK